MIKTVREKSYDGWFWRLRAFVEVVWFALRHRRLVFIAVDIAADQSFTLGIRYVGLSHEGMSTVVREYLEYADASFEVLSDAKEILGEANDQH